MANPWCRLWSDMPNDPKWRVISAKSGQCIGDVIAVYVHMMVCASNANERGRTQSFVCEDVGAALGIDELAVVAIREAMQGRVLDGDHLAGWEKRQPIKEDGASERAKAWRINQKEDSERNRTQPNATERTEEIQIQIREEEIKTRTKTTASAKPSASPVLFDGIPDQLVADFKALRKLKRAPVTQTAIDGIKREAAIAGITLEAALSMCCERGWSGFKAEWSGAQGVQGRGIAPVDLAAAQRASTEEARRKLFGNKTEVFDV